MTRQEIIQTVKANNEGFFSKSNTKFFGDQKYRWLIKYKLLAIDVKRQGMLTNSLIEKTNYYSFDNETFDLRFLPDLDNTFRRIASKLNEQCIYSDNFTLAKAEKALSGCILAQNLTKMVKQYTAEIKRYLD